VADTNRVDELQPEYDFTSGERGKYYGQYTAALGVPADDPVSAGSVDGVRAVDWHERIIGDVASPGEDVAAERGGAVVEARDLGIDRGGWA
jgi:hypothetical protein